MAWMLLAVAEGTWEADIQAIFIDLILPFGECGLAAIFILKINPNLYLP